MLDRGAFSLPGTGLAGDGCITIFAAD
jgi:hypothetical protein